MFDLDRWQEILNTLARNKFRTILTAFGVFWGILMLVIMLGSAKGLSNGMYLIMGDFATNSLFIWPENTTVPYKGFPKDRSWDFTNEDTKFLKDYVAEIEIVAPRVYPPRRNNLFVRGKNTGAFYINGDYPEYYKIDPVTLTQGRFLNNLDIRDLRKVVVIGKRVKESLFDPNEDPIGQYIQIQGVYFQVIGVFKSKHTQGWANFQNESVFMPFTTLQKTYNLGNIVRYYSITAKRQYSVAYVEKKVRALLSKRHTVSPDDAQAFGSNNIEEQFKNGNRVFVGMNFLPWFVGTLTLIAGVIGISNIMLVVVKERTKEIGVQRAIGATPVKIVGQILLESIFLTFVAGVIGMICGVAILEVVRIFLANVPPDRAVFINPEVNFRTVVSALILLVIAGTFAGFIPARRAIKIKPVDAIRTEL